ncbi:pentapeptide repeat-containing protein [Streptomyces sp. NPDC087440]|uniref:pentapeptide repeat-containing protein n=1 Tax=Streptomyces sp. NPDC087440 TaxID=3365790 RepID=UPI00380BDA0D
MAPNPADPPDWPHCGHGADLGGGDPVGCRGIRVGGSEGCLAHLPAEECTAYLDGLRPGDPVDHRGTPFDTQLLATVLRALDDPERERPRLGDARFEGAVFTGDAWFGAVDFGGGAWFDGATFSGEAQFDRAAFAGEAGFEGARFTKRGAGAETSASFHSVNFAADALFGGAYFADLVRFDSAVFRGPAWFPAATFWGDAHFDAATFTHEAVFGGARFQNVARFGAATFSHDARFSQAAFGGVADFEGAAFAREARFVRAGFTAEARFNETAFTGDALFHATSFARGVAFRSATFEQSTELGPIISRGTVDFSGAVFRSPLTLAIAAPRVSCQRAHWMSSATIRLRFARADFEHAVFEYPVAVSCSRAPFAAPGSAPMDDSFLGNRGFPTVWLTSLRGVDAAHLVLSDINLSRCRFTGTIHLEQLRLEGVCSFNGVPAGTHWRFGLPRRFTPRRTLVEEHHWRAQQLTGVRGWQFRGPDPNFEYAGPSHLAAVYRQLRKSFEDSKNEPGAADFYYGEMEMRRHDRSVPRAERGLLHAYWALSGYGLRAARAMSWLLLAMTGTLLAMMLWGLPTEDPHPVSTGTISASGRDVRLTTDTPPPMNPTTALPERLTTSRFEKSLRVVVNSVVFRSSGQGLTTVGTYTEMASRLAEPVLLGFAVLAVRGRVKR